MIFLVAVLNHTPLWVWAVLALIIAVGLTRLRERTVTSTRLVLMPLVIGLLAASNLLTAGGSAEVLLGAVIGIVAGAGSGLILERLAGTAQVARGIVRIKGDWASFAVLLAIFLVHYVTAVVQNVDPVLAAGAEYHFVTTLISTFFAAMTLSRTGMRLRIAYA